MNETGNFIQSTNRHASKMEALTPDPSSLDEKDIFSRGCETD
jgi:hypothetical protein